MENNNDKIENNNNDSDLYANPFSNNDENEENNGNNDNNQVEQKENGINKEILNKNEDNNLNINEEPKIEEENNKDKTCESNQKINNEIINQESNKIQSKLENLTLNEKPNINKTNDINVTSKQSESNNLKNDQKKVTPSKRTKYFLIKETGSNIYIENIKKMSSMAIEKSFNKIYTVSDFNEIFNLNIIKTYPVDAVLGIIDINGNNKYILVVSSSKLIANIIGADIYNILDVDLIKITLFDESENERNRISGVKKLFQSKNFYFSNQIDLCQNLFIKNRKNIINDFCVNSSLLKCFFDNLIPPELYTKIIYGYVGFKQNTEIKNEKNMIMVDNLIIERVNKHLKFNSDIANHMKQIEFVSIYKLNNTNSNTSNKNKYNINIFTFIFYVSNEIANNNVQFNPWNNFIMNELSQFPNIVCVLHNNINMNLNNNININNNSMKNIIFNSNQFGTKVKLLNFTSDWKKNLYFDSNNNSNDFIRSGAINPNLIQEYVFWLIDINNQFNESDYCFNTIIRLMWKSIQQQIDFMHLGINIGLFNKNNNQIICSKFKDLIMDYHNDLDTNKKPIYKSQMRKQLQKVFDYYFNIYAKVNNSKTNIYEKKINNNNMQNNINATNLEEKSNFNNNNFNAYQNINNFQNKNNYNNNFNNFNKNQNINNIQNNNRLVNPFIQNNNINNPKNNTNFANPFKQNQNINNVQNNNFGNPFLQNQNDQMNINDNVMRSRTQIIGHKNKNNMNNMFNYNNMNINIDKPPSPKKLSVLCITWNVGGINAEENYDIRDLFTQNIFYKNVIIPDIIIIGLEEIVELDIYNILSITTNEDSVKNWTKNIISTINSLFPYTFKQISVLNLVGIYCICLAQSHLKENIDIIESKVVKTGLFGTLGNKGYVVLNLKLYKNLEISFAVGHLEAGTSKNSNEERISTLKQILNTKLGEKDEEEGYIKRFKHSDIWIILGDLNFRIDVSFELSFELIQRREFENLYEFDQLYQSRLKDGGLIDINEGKINFPPTYKYISGSNNYLNELENLRTPSWTDRILFCQKNNIRNINYSSIPTIMYSDHRPVQACFEINIQQQKQAINLGLNNNYNKQPYRNNNYNNPFPGNFQDNRNNNMNFGNNNFNMNNQNNFKNDYNNSNGYMKNMNNFGNNNYNTQIYGNNNYNNNYNNINSHRNLGYSKNFNNKINNNNFNNNINNGNNFQKYSQNNYNNQMNQNNHNNNFGQRTNSVDKNKKQNQKPTFDNLTKSMAFVPFNRNEQNNNNNNNNKKDEDDNIDNIEKFFK